jgi:hypothetical protein
MSDTSSTVGTLCLNENEVMSDQFFDLRYKSATMSTYHFDCTDSPTVSYNSAVGRVSLTFSFSDFIDECRLVAYPDGLGYESSRNGNDFSFQFGNSWRMRTGIAYP